MTATLIAKETLNAGSLADRHAGTAIGSKPAYLASDGSLSYDQLREEADRAAGLLAELGLGREERLLLVLDDTTVFPVMFLGAMRAGVVPVPVSPLDKNENFRHFVEDSYARTVVTDANVLSRVQEALAGIDVRFLVKGVEESGVIELGAALAAQPAEFDVVTTHRDDVAFWLYSSGSTGKPKGVVHLHHDIEVTCRSYGDQIVGIREDDLTFSTTKLFHAYGLGNGFSFPLWAGATVALMSGPTKPEPIIATLRERRPTVFSSVPALYAALLREPEDVVAEALSSVRICVSAAEALPANTVETWRSRFGLEILDGIGSTEMLHIFCSNRPGEIRPGTTGVPVPGYDLRLIDSDGMVVDGAGTGSLEVRGDSCAAYYWHQHEKSKLCMRGEWYATGDMYERGPDGVYSYVGRGDDMFKVGGLWVSSTDLEAVLGEHPTVIAAGVVGARIDGDSRIVAYVEVAEPVDEERLSGELRELCKGRMRRYEYPHLVRIIDPLPRTLSGKLQRYKLREMIKAEGLATSLEGPDRRPS
ncbi:MAG TPA: benzoate-CoA ligase family protein [Solirubrobacterales bacterium]|nr:benzoate-CoA ligase family protein [Solirubrobacterales bacterium]